MLRLNEPSAKPPKKPRNKKKGSGAARDMYFAFYIFQAAFICHEGRQLIFFTFTALSTQKILSTTIDTNGKQ